MSILEITVFVAMVFGAVLLLSLALIIPTVSPSAQAGRRMRKKISTQLNDSELDNASLIRRNAPSETRLSQSRFKHHPIFRSLETTISQAGLAVSVQRLLLTAIILGLMAFIFLMFVFDSLLIASGAGFLAFFLPIVRLRIVRKHRLNRFELQLPQALDIMARALKAGHPFNETLNFVANEMDEPIASEFGRVFSDINYGLPAKTAFLALMERIPSVGLHTLITAVLIQQESGGALAEILEKVANVVRGRFKLQRKLKTLSAEGRMSAWVLALIPFILAGMLMVVSPNYLTTMTEDPNGQKLIYLALALLVVGVLWIRKVIDIKV